ncbi:uncharacterized protein LOC132190359 isoform X2 [Corylus avellana]|uniref:uncharacterized protein LOC132190359 isoform X2 n=1 Tax=Corylus avellana TaxID=13451 RepID=UPI00286D2651|nr:uncharacterized protein LOC132190359 isoform X2 [Corylus avellana]
MPPPVKPTIQNHRTSPARNPADLLPPQRPASPTIAHHPKIGKSPALVLGGLSVSPNPQNSSLHPLPPSSAGHDQAVPSTTTNFRRTPAISTSRGLLASTHRTTPTLEDYRGRSPVRERDRDRRRDRDRYRQFRN